MVAAVNTLTVFKKNIKVLMFQNVLLKYILYWYFEARQNIKAENKNNIWELCQGDSSCTNGQKGNLSTSKFIIKKT